MIPIHRAGCWTPKIESTLRFSERRARALEILTGKAAFWRGARLIVKRGREGTRIESRSGKARCSFLVTVSPQEAWEAAVSRDLIPASWLDHPRRFYLRAALKQSPWPESPWEFVSLLSHPPALIERAEALVLDALDRLRSLGADVPKTERAVCWTLHPTKDYAYLHGWPDLTPLFPPGVADTLAKQPLAGFAWWEAHQHAWAGDASPYAPIATLFQTPFRLLSVGSQGLTLPILGYPEVCPQQETS